MNKKYRDNVDMEVAFASATKNRFLRVAPEPLPEINMSRVSTRTRGYRRVIYWIFGPFIRPVAFRLKRYLTEDLRREVHMLAHMQDYYIPTPTNQAGRDSYTLGVVKRILRPFAKFIYSVVRPLLRWSAARLKHYFTHDLRQEISALSRSQAAKTAGMAQTDKRCVPGIIMMGAGGHAKVCIELLYAMGEQVDYCICTTDGPDKCMGIPVLQGDENLQRLHELGYNRVFIAIGDNVLRGKLAKFAIQAGYTCVNALSPTAVISPTARLGKGIAVMPGAVINADASIADFAIINTRASIDHDCQIGVAVHIAPQCALAGNVQVGQYSFLGIGARVIPAMVLGEHVTIGAGAVVTSDISTGATAVGVPAKVIKAVPNNEVNVDRISVAQPKLAGNERLYVLDCLDTSWISSNGKYITLFEKMFAEFCGVKHAVTTNNGTTALHLALVALDLKPGDEVIIPTVTYIATANAVHYCGATPVLVDVCADTMNIDPRQIERKITSKTRGIIPVHLYGHPADMDAINEIAHRHGLWVVEDAAEAHGAEVNGKKVGSLSTCATFSFFGNKIVTTGEGGMVTTNDDALAAKLRLYRGQGMDLAHRYWFPVVGYNYRMTNIQAALGVAQMETVAEALLDRQRLADWYNNALADLQDRIILPIEQPWAKHVYWMYTIFLKTGGAHERDALMRALDEAGVETRPVFYPMHTLPPYREETAYPMADCWAGRGINLPTHQYMTQKDVKRIAHCLEQAWVM